jgi:Glycosyl transferase family 2
MKVVMTLLVRNEEDILAANLDFHLAGGVDFFIVTDNLSVDGTRDIIESYVRQGVAAYLHEPKDDYSQSRWVTRMARMAAIDYGADWVINSDADEFWGAENAEGSIKDALCSVAPEVQALTVPRFNFQPVDDHRQGFFAERMTFRDRVSRNPDGELLQPKVCHRAMNEIEVDQGNHGVSLKGAPLTAEPAPMRILHYPMRSYRQFENKIILGGAAYARNEELPKAIGITWRNLYQLWQSGGLRAHYMERVIQAEEIEARLLSGELIYDDTLCRVLSNWQINRGSVSAASI